MSRLLVVVLAAVLTLGSVAWTPDGAPERRPTAVLPEIERFSLDIAMKHVRHLAKKIGVRVRATKGERRAARYVAEKFESYGYEVKIQKFKVDGGKSRNVIARWPESSRFTVVIGGHMDSVPGSPGANDNASGTAVVLETARIVAATPKAKWLKFVAFGSEEYGTDGRHHVGSQVFVNRLGKEGRRNTTGMLSVDMVADGRPLIVGTSGIAHAVVAWTILRHAEKSDIAAVYKETCDCSDNGPFERAGIPAAFAWSGSEPNYHSPSDRVRNMKERDLLRTGRVVRAFVKAVDRKMIRRFRGH